MPWLQSQEQGAYAGGVRHNDGTVDYYEWVPESEDPTHADTLAEIDRINRAAKAAEEEGNAAAK